jgi:hypothetical protein
MDSLHDSLAGIDVDAEAARILRRRSERQAGYRQSETYSYWQIAVAGSLTGAGICIAGILIGLAITRALH